MAALQRSSEPDAASFLALQRKPNQRANDRRRAYRAPTDTGTNLVIQSAHDSCHNPASATVGTRAMTANSVSIGILGATGYTGAELLRLLHDHPQARVAGMTAERYAGQPIEAVFPHLAGRGLPTLTKVGDFDLGALDVVFGCLPHGTTQDVIRDMPRGPKVIDLSADFRLRDPALYERTYGQPHRAVERQADAVYGLTELRARRDPGDRSGGQSRLLSDHRPAAAAAAARGRADRARPDRDRRQVGRQRRRARRQGGIAAHRGERGPARLRGRHAPAHAGDRAGPVRCRRAAGRGDLHAAPRADEPRHPRDDLRAPRGRASQPADLQAELERRYRGRAVRARAAVQEPAGDPPRARHQSLPDRGASRTAARPRDPALRSPTIWSRAPRARRCRT